MRALKLMILGIAAACFCPLAGCEDDGPIEETAEDLDDAVEDAGDDLEDAFDDIDN